MLNLSEKERAFYLVSQGFSCRQIAKELGVVHTTVSRWINTHNSNKGQNGGAFFEGGGAFLLAPSPKPELAQKEGPLLDIYTKYSSPPSQKALKEDESQISLANDEISAKFPHSPLTKWKLHAIARGALGPTERISRCYMRIRADFLKAHKNIEIRGGLISHPYFVGLEVCGSVWCCPVCSVKIQAVRALEVRRAIDAWMERGGSVWMVTQTVPHTRQDDLGKLLKGFSAAFQAFKSGKQWLQLRDRHKISGYIKALEVTWSERNGWHPHTHTIFFLDNPPWDVNLRGFKTDLFSRWEKITAKAGFGALSKEAFSVQDASKVRMYLNKMTGEYYNWSSEHELVKANTKRARGFSYSPLDFLRAYLGKADDGRFLALFAEFAISFKGKRHLVWSKGWKKRMLGSEGKTDEEIAVSVGEIDAVLAMITPEQWEQLLKIQRYGWQGELLQIVQEFGETGLRYYLEGQGILSDCSR